MSKRRLTNQQQSRVKAKQDAYHQSILDNPEESQEGLVISRFGKQAEIENQQGERCLCSIRANIHSLVAGDKVLWQPSSEGQGVIVSLFSRTSVLSRPNQRNEEKTVAANISQLIIVIAPKPEVSWPLLDSYLVIAELLSFKPLIVLNKSDLPHGEIDQVLREIYKPLGYNSLQTSNQAQSGIIALETKLKDEISVFVGQSGVGKSSLISQLLPDEEIATQQLSLISELGQHTTSNSRYYHLQRGGGIIDSPGVREFSLWHIAPGELAYAYLEFRPLLGLCKFRDCNHLDAPGCAIISAIEEGKISALRYDNFCRLISKFHT